MKHPAYRCSDILFVDPVWRDKVFDYVRQGIERYIRAPLNEWLDRSEKITGLTYKRSMRLQLCGSMPFGCATLHSDWDFNLSLDDWNAQAEARSWFFVGDNLKDLIEYLTDFTRETGLSIQVGCVDPHSDDYNIYVDLDTMLLHRRGSKLPHQTLNNDFYTTNDRIPEILPPVDLRTWNPIGKLVAPSSVTPVNVTDFNADIHVPPVAYQHLAWDGYAMRWNSMPNRRMMARPAVPVQPMVPLVPPRWSGDEWADIAPEWEARYGERYTGYAKLHLTNDNGEPVTILEEIPCRAPR